MKRYGALFTCLASRAVHIEVADSLETDSLINALDVSSVDGDQSGKFAAIEERISLVQKQNSRKLLKKWMTRKSKQNSLRKASIGLRT